MTTPTPFDPQKALPIKQYKGERWVDASDLHRALESTYPFTDWKIMAIRASNAQSSVDYCELVTGVQTYINIGDALRRPHNLPCKTLFSLAFAYKIASASPMDSRATAILQYLTRFIEQQAPAEEAPVLPNFTNPAEAARAWADQYEARVQAEKQAADQNAELAVLRAALEDFVEQARPWLEIDKLRRSDI